MSFLAPLFLAGALAAAIPIVLHLLKREPDTRVPFAAVRMLRHAPVEHTARRRLRELMLLALRVAALMLLALAFARPYVASGELAADSVTVIALDTSLSLSAPGQFERSRQLALAALERVPADRAVAVVTFADRADVGSPVAADRAVARAAIQEAAPGYGGTSFKAALDAAGGLFEGRPGTIVVVTDLQESGWREGDLITLPESIRIEVVDVGVPPPNLAVTAARTSGGGIAATVRNASSAARSARLTSTVDGTAAGEATVTVPAGQSVEVRLPVGNGIAATVSVDDPEGIQADNLRYLVLADRRQPTVLVVTGSGDLEREALYLKSALAAAVPDGGMAREAVAGVGAAALSTWDGNRLNTYAAVVIMSTRGLDRRGRDLIAAYVRDGGGVLIAAGANVDGEVAAAAAAGAVQMTPPSDVGRAEGRTLAPLDVRHPILRAFATGRSALGLVSFGRIASIGGAACGTLARFTTGEPALVDCAAGAGRVLVLASDLENVWNNFPQHATFVPFVQETVAYLGSARRRPLEYLIADVPPGVPVRPGLVVLPDTADQTATGNRRVAVNVDPAEAEPGRLSVEGFEAPVTRLKDAPRTMGTASAGGQEASQNWWRYILALMVGMLVLESLVGIRTA